MPRRFSRDTRGLVVNAAVWLLLLVTALGVLALSRMLSPSPTGLGTHQQLGLPPCGLLVAVGLPCPACGLTTAFAHLAHLELFASIAAHPLGLPLFLGTGCCAPLALRALWQRRSVLEVIDEFSADKLALGFVLATLCVWGARLLALGG